MGALSDLRSVIAEFETKVDSILASNERDYLSVYDSHSGKLNQELSNMRLKVSTVDKVAARASHIDHLRSETKWFSSEAIRLSSLCKSHKKSLLKWRALTQSLDQEKAFIEKLHLKVTNRMRDLNARGRSLIEFSEQALAAPTERTTNLPIEVVVPSDSTINERLEKARFIESEIARVEAEIALVKKQNSVAAEEGTVTRAFRALINERQIGGKRLTKTDHVQIIQSLLSNPDVLNAISN